MRTLGRPRITLLLIIALLVTPSVVATQESSPDIHWLLGPVLAPLGSNAEIQVPDGFAFTSKAGTKKLLEYTQNLVAGNEVGALIPSDSTHAWFAIFQFSDIGYVKDDDKDKIDAEGLLKSIREGTEEANKERSKKGWATYTVEGWEKPPYYDASTHNLTWAIRGRSSTGDVSINHSVRILGRRGTMDVDLVLAPEEYATAQGPFESALSGFRFKQGNQYADFVKGDKIAAYGLSALVLGGAGAVALKTGLLAKSWKLILVVLLALKKFILVVLLAIGGAIKHFFGRARRVVAPKDEVPRMPEGGGGSGL